ncbi:hypothetical protein CGRA01v4_14532 [Colletotrichum graminicola]|nr:hypothetical protein CGRA01v4_14532 [Colletotrichum graminicola]
MTLFTCACRTISGHPTVLRPPTPIFPRGMKPLPAHAYHTASKYRGLDG